MEEIKSPVKGIRAFCLSCFGGSPYEVWDCRSRDCALKHFRLCENPYMTKLKLTEQQQAAAAARLAAAWRKKDED